MLSLDEVLELFIELLLMPMVVSHDVPEDPVDFVDVWAELLVSPPESF